MIKKYEYKLYNREWNFKKQINPRDISSDLSFSEQIDGWQGDLQLTVIDDIANYQTSDIIEIREVTTKWLWIWATYTGIIETINIKETKQGAVLKIELLGVFTALNDIIFKNMVGDRVFDLTDTIENIVNQIINWFNWVYGSLSNTQNLDTYMFNTEIEAGTPTVSIKFENDSCMQALNKVLDNSGYHWYVNQYWTIIIKAKSSQRLLYLALEREIVSVDIELNKNDMVNRLYLARNGGTVVSYTDGTAETVFGPKEKFVSDNTIADLATQDIKWWEYIDQHKTEMMKVKLTIKPQVSWVVEIINEELEVDYTQYMDPTAITPTIIGLQPWDRISTMNTKNYIISQVIVKIDKAGDKRVIHLWEYLSFWQQVAGIWLKK